MTKKQRQLYTYIVLGWCAILFFIPIRNDIITENFFDKDGHPAHEKVHEVLTSNIVTFNGHPAGRIALGLFALIPFLFMLETDSFKRPLHIWSHVFIRLQGVILILAGPYVYYVLTYEDMDYEVMQHYSTPAWGGYILMAQCLGMGILMLWLIATPNGKLTTFLLPVRVDMPKKNTGPQKREGW